MEDYYDRVCIWLGLICAVIAGVIAHDVSKLAFLLTFGLYVLLCVFATEKRTNRPIGFFVAALTTIVVMLLLKFNLHYAFMAIPTGMIVGYVLASDRDFLTSVAVWVYAMVWGVLLFCINCLMYLLI